MKSDRYRLAKWLGDYTDGYVDIPWPLVHEQAGSEMISWITGLRYQYCQPVHHFVAGLQNP